MIRDSRDAVMALLGAAFVVAMATESYFVALVAVVLLSPWKKCSEASALVLDEVAAWRHSRRERAEIRERRERVLGASEEEKVTAIR